MKYIANNELMKTAKRTKVCKIASTDYCKRQKNFDNDNQWCVVVSVVVLLSALSQRTSSKTRTIFMRCFLIHISHI